MLKKFNSNRHRPPVLGQHWLIDQVVVGQIATSLNLGPTDNVFEIGVGSGRLTDHLLRAKPKKIIGLEYDSGLVERLQLKYQSDIKAGRLEIIQADCRHYDFTLLPIDYKLYTNTPYYLAANLLRRLVDEINLPKEAVLLLPRAVVCKLIGPKPNLIGCLLGFKYQLTAGLVVEPQSFRPPPKIKSRSLILHRREVADNPIITLQWSALVDFIKAGFCQPRRMVSNNLSANLAVDKTQLGNLIRQVGVNIQARPADLTQKNWLDLYQLFTT